MATLKEIIAEKEARLDNVPDILLTEVQKAQKKLLGELSKLMDKLDVAEGKISLTQKNLALIETIGTKLQDALFEGEYLGAVKNFAKQFPEQADLSNQYFKKVFGDDFEDKKVFEEIIKSSQKNALKLLDSDAIQASFIEPLKESLRTSITTGSSFSEAVQSLTNFIQGTPELDGKLIKYVKQVAYDGFAIADREYTKVISEQLGVEWFKYSGGTISDTREFCIKRHGKYFHKKEVEAWGNIKQWQGRNSATNSSTIFGYAGGYNCKHSIMPVSIEIVPKDVIARNVANGNYKDGKAEEKPESKFVPAKTIEEARLYAKERLGITNDTRKLPLQAMNEINESLTELVDTYNAPKLKILSSVGGNGLAIASAKRYEIRFSEAYFKNIPDLEKEIANSVKTKFYHAKAKTVKDLVEHEFAHVLTEIDVIKHTENVGAKLNVLRNKYIAEMKALKNEGKNPFDSDNFISTYADKDLNEFTAESFAYARAGGKSKYAIEVLNILNAAYKK